MSRNKTSEAVQDHISCIVVPAKHGINAASVELKGESFKKFVAILMKYQKMEEALQSIYEDNHTAYDESRRALAFDPLSQ